MFDAAREGNSELLLAAIDAGLPPNLTNPKGAFSSVLLVYVLTPHTTGSARFTEANSISLKFESTYSFFFLIEKIDRQHVFDARGVCRPCRTCARPVQRGADPNRLNDLGQAPIAGAVFKREDEVVRVLMEAGADPRAGEPNAIASARMFGRTDLLGVLGARKGEVEDTLAVPSA